MMLNSLVAGAAGKYRSFCAINYVVKDVRVLE